MLGNRIGVQFSNYTQNLKNLLKSSGAVLALLADYPRGVKLTDYSNLNTPPLTQWVD